MSSAGVIRTHNGFGWTSNVPNQITCALLADLNGSVDRSVTVLDIGAGLGVATLPLLETGATVLANDLEVSHLDVIRAEAEKRGCTDRLICKVGRFPTELQFEELDTIHCSNVLHFLSGEEIEVGAQLMRKWLKEDGRVYIQVGTIYAGHITRLLPIFEERRKQGVRWAGETEHARDLVHPEFADVVPQFMNYLDAEPVIQAFEDAGFKTEKAWYYTRNALPEVFRSDGREHFGYIGRKNWAGRGSDRRTGEEQCQSLVKQLLRVMEKGMSSSSARLGATTIWLSNGS